MNNNYMNSIHESFIPNIHTDKQIYNNYAIHVQFY